MTYNLSFFEMLVKSLIFIYNAEALRGELAEKKHF